MSPIVAFELKVADADLDDLRSRVRATRWPEAETVDDWSQGIPLLFVQDLCHYWSEEYDWRAVERRLNEIGQFKTEIDGLTIHFLHRRSPHRRCAAAGADPWLARFGGRVHEGDRAADRARAVRWLGGGRLPRRVSVAAGVWLQRQADRHRVGHPAHRRRLGRVDEPAGLRALRRSGWRLGLGGHHHSGPAGPRARGRDPHQHGVRRAGGHRRGWDPERGGAGGAGSRSPPIADRDQATRASSRPGLRRWATAWSILPSASAPGSWRSSASGRIATAIPSTCSRATSCSTT